MSTDSTEARARPRSETPSQAMTDVMAERWRQIDGEGWTTEHDDRHSKGQLTEAASAYLLAAHFEMGTGHRPSRSVVPQYWPWARSRWKPNGLRRTLVKAAALIIAEIERLDRAAGRAA